jgi:adenosylcobinamide-phosphate synthase
MKFLSLVIALLIEQVYPLRHGNPIYAMFRRYTATLESQLNGGQYRHGVLAWALAVAPPVVLAVLLYHGLQRLNPLLALAWSVAVLYLTMGFRQFSRSFNEIMLALREDRLDGARERLALWRGLPATSFTGSEVARVSIELGLVDSHRHVFGPLAWFIVLGPGGAVLYRIAAMLHDDWGRRGDAGPAEFGGFAQRLFFWIDWLPARLTAASFAVVGNFEDAVYCWRTQARSWSAQAEGVILASGGGALGVRLGDALHGNQGMEVRPELGTGEEADVDYMQSGVGLIWRALVLWVFLVFLVTLAHAL